MRKSRAETAETRQRIVEIASQAFRERGVHATGLADVMSEAGLSHGGFYRHFDSKEHLIAEALAAGMTTILNHLEAAAGASKGKEGFKAIVDAYVSTAHRDRRATGCPIAGMASELARADEETRAAASRGLEGLVEVLAKRIGNRQPEAARSKAVFALAAMIGGITMSRLITDPDVSSKVLQDVKHQLDAI